MVKNYMKTRHYRNDVDIKVKYNAQARSDLSNSTKYKSMVITPNASKKIRTPSLCSRHHIISGCHSKLHLGDLALGQALLDTPRKGHWDLAAQLLDESAIDRLREAESGLNNIAIQTEEPLCDLVGGCIDIAENSNGGGRFAGRVPLVVDAALGEHAPLESVQSASQLAGALSSSNETILKDHAELESVVHGSQELVASWVDVWCVHAAWSKEEQCSTEIAVSQPRESGNISIRLRATQLALSWLSGVEVEDELLSKLIAGLDSARILVDEEFFGAVDGCDLSLEELRELLLCVSAGWRWSGCRGRGRSWRRAGHLWGWSSHGGRGSEAEDDGLEKSRHCD